MKYDNVIKFEEIFNLDGLIYKGEKIKSSEIKIKFNMHNNDGDKTKTALYCLYHDEEEWKDMVGHYNNSGPTQNYGEAKYVLAFAKNEGLGNCFYVFGGFYKVDKKENAVSGGRRGYKLKLLDDFSQYIKRIVIKTEKSVGETINMWYQKVVDDYQPTIFEMLPPDTNDLGPFPGYGNVLLNYEKLKDVLISPQWNEALSIVKGIYCITDKSDGKIYVGSATGGKGILGRWEDYIKSIDGGNKSLKTEDRDHMKSCFLYSILEIYDTRIKKDEIIQKEHHWIRVFQSANPKCGFNNTNAKKYNLNNDKNSSYEVPSDKKIKKYKLVEE